MSDLSRYKSIKVSRDGDIVILTLNRPDRLNAVDRQMHHELTTVFLDADKDPESKVIVITGAGRAFCAGGDVSGMNSESGTNLEQTGRIRHEGIDLITNMLLVEKPILAMVNGVAVGLGANLALFSDVIVAAEDARFGDRHVTVGLVAGDGGSVIWPALIGVARAKEYLMTGDLIDASKAAEIGLINHAVPPDQLRPFTLELAHRLAEQMPYAVRATKAAINRLLRRQIFDVMDVAMAWEELSIKMEDHKEAARAFLEKRKPRFSQ